MNQALIEQNFRGIRHFSPDEFEYPDKVDHHTLYLLDCMRDIEGPRHHIIITIDCAYVPRAQGGHAPHSMHYMGKAIDCVLRDARSREPLPIVEQFLIALRYTWTGIGFYPFWHAPGLHLDTRPVTRFMPRALWWRDKEGEYRAVEEFFKAPRNGGQEARHGHYWYWELG